MEPQRDHGTYSAQANSLVLLPGPNRSCSCGWVPLLFHLRRDPYEGAAITSNAYYDWMLDRVFLLVPAQKYVGEFLQTFKEFPPRQKAARFSLKQVMKKMTSAGAQ